MPAEENKAIIRRALEYWNDPDNRERYFDLYDENVVTHGFPPGLPPGVAGLQQFYRGLWTAFPDARVVIKDLVCGGDKVALRGIFEGTHQGDFNGVTPTGKQVTMELITILHFANGKCVERWNQADMLGLMQQLGAIPGQEAD